MMDGLPKAMRRERWSATDDSRTTPLHRACTAGNTRTIKALVDSGSSIYTVDDYGCTPLHLFVASDGLSEVVRYMLQHGADMEATDHNEMKPLHYAVRKGRLSVVLELLEYGVMVDDISSPWSAMELSDSLGHDQITAELKKYRTRKAAPKLPCIVVKRRTLRSGSVHDWTEAPALSRRSTKLGERMRALADHARSRGGHVSVRRLISAQSPRAWEHETCQDVPEHALQDMGIRMFVDACGSRTNGGIEVRTLARSPRNSLSASINSSSPRSHPTPRATLVAV